MTRPVNATDALRRAVEAQKVQRDAIREAARSIAEEREREADRQPESESTQ